MTDRRHLHFVVDWGFLRGLHDTWAEEGSQVETIADPQTYIDYVREAEAAGIDAYFVTDFIGLNRNWLAHRPRPPFEPLTLLGALAVQTDRIGLVGTVSTSFTEPYNVARQFRSLEHLSGGRIGWNVVTSFNGEKNFGFTEIPDPAWRYRRAEEYLDVVGRLWESWQPGAVLRDRDRNEYADLAKIIDLEHRGEFFGVQDALDLEPGSQRRPVIFQAGASAQGLEFASRHAEAIFVTAPTLEAAEEFNRRLSAGLQWAGRKRSSVNVLPGLRIFLGETEAEAREAFLQPLSGDDIESAQFALDREFPGLGLRDADLDEPVPHSLLPTEELIRQSDRRISTALIYRGLALRPWRSVREYLTYYFWSKGHAVAVGTPDAVAHQLETWHDSGAVDGFIVSGGNDRRGFYDEVLPRLERVGAWRAPSADRSFRQNLELDS